MQGVVALGRAQAPASPTASPTATPPPIVNQTTHGVIGWDEIWRDEIRIIGDIIVEEGATLTIEPGTVVLIAANQDVDNLNDAPWGMQEGFEYGRPVETSEGNLLGLDEPYWDEGHHVSIRVLGTLHAVGTPEQMITITSDSATPGIYDWNFFAFAHGTLSYSIVQYYRCLNAGDEAEVSHNILRHIGGAGVAPGSAVIEHNTISYGTHESINIDHSSPVIRYNHLGPNPGHAGIVIDGGSPQIVGNTIEGCAAGIALISPPDDPVIEGNTFLNNEEDIVRRY
jgi:parallel beta-helix repeat protein